MKVFLTRRAERDYKAIKEHIREKWGERTAESFELKVDDLFRLLKVFPEMGPIETQNIRGLQLSRQTRLFYRIKGQRIAILRLFDVRQDPKEKPR